MSVINQMLKDLDKRQQNNATESSNSTAVIIDPPKSQRRLITLLILSLVAALAIIVWQKMAAKGESTLILPAQSAKKSSVNPTMPAITHTKKMAGGPSVNNKVTDETGTLEESEPASQLIQPPVATTVMVKPKVKSENKIAEVETQLRARTAPLQQANGTLATSNVNKENEKLVPLAVKHTEPSLTISRKQLTPTQLTAKKVAQAEQALSQNNIRKAEQLFEDVLLITPTHKAARKQLAALWFGKQSYQPALNLLSQGLALTPNDIEFRLMKARIYLKQGRAALALDVLAQRPEVSTIEYQSLLATTAQQLNQFEVAEQAYLILTTLSPNMGRWWLGLAIAQDSQSRFNEAKVNYKNAIIQQDLSNNTAQFAKNRILELGE